MGGGLMQLVAYGAQDIYLTGKPQITFFKVVYRRHTNFSMESIQQTFSGSTGYGKRVTSTISRNGDLVHKMYLEHSFTTTAQAGGDSHFCNNYGHALIRECELEIGGQRIDKQYGRWMQIWSDLTEPNPTKAGPDVTGALANKHPGDRDGHTLFQRMTGTGMGLDGNNNGDKITPQATQRYFIPLQFWFCRNPGLALPLIALQYHEVKVIFEFEDEEKLLRETDTPTTALSGSSFDLWVDYIYLDTDERRRFAQVSHEYLIEQLQYQNSSYTASTTQSIDLNFNHPVKELVWQFSDTASEASLLNVAQKRGDESTLAAGVDILSGEFKLKLNGHDRFAERDYRYFTRLQIHQHHTGFGGTVAKDSIAVYSFALKPEEHQPSGTCNFSRIDNAQLQITTAVTRSAAVAIPGGNAATITNCHIYAVNYNVLRIMSGMGGLAYSN